jgi:2-oxoglutarate ferredoxin oxidoreductase subunit beta
MMKWMRDNAVMKAAWDKLDPNTVSPEKFPIGLLYEAAAMDYDTAYDQVIERAGGAHK